MTTPSGREPSVGKLAESETAALLDTLARIELDERDGVLNALQANQPAAGAVVDYLQRRRLMRGRSAPT